MTWPVYDRPPAAAFVDVDGTLLAQTTTYLFARILRRRGLIRRSFILRALYHGLQHRFGREPRQKVGRDDRLICPHYLLVARIECRADLLPGGRAHGAENMIHAVVVGEFEEVLDL